MILYRLAVYYTGASDPDWAVEWLTTKDDARREFLKAHKNTGIVTAVVHRTDVPTDKAGLAEALNRSFDNPVNWPWTAEEVFSTLKEARRS